MKSVNLDKKVLHKTRRSVCSEVMKAGLSVSGVAKVERI